MRLQFALAALALGLAAPVAAAAPQAIAVGSAAVDGARLEPYRNRFDQQVRFGDGTGTQGRIEWTDTLERVNVRGRQLLQQRIVTYRKADGAIIADGGALFDALTLAPWSSWEVQSDKEYWFAQFRNDGREMAALSSRASDGSTPRLLSWTSEASPFDTFNATFGLLLAAMPLADGYSVTYPAVADGKSAVVTQSARVVGRDSFATARGVRPVWVVEVANQGETASATFWISDKPPYVMKQESRQMLNGREAVFTWTSLG